MGKRAQECPMYLARVGKGTSGIRMVKFSVLRPPGQCAHKLQNGRGRLSLALTPSSLEAPPLDGRTEKDPSPSGGCLENYLVPICHPFVSDFCHVALQG